MAFFCLTVCVVAQEAPKEVVVVMKRSFTYEDPRWNNPTRQPYLGKRNGFYKTAFNGREYYISAKYCLLK